MHEMNFEKSLARLEEITQKLEAGELTLDESLKIFEEGIKLSRICEKKLTEAEKKIEILKSTDIDEIIKSEITDGKKDSKQKKKSKEDSKDKTANSPENFLF